MRPDLTLLHPIYQRYLQLVPPQSSVMDALGDHKDCLAFYRQIPEEKLDYRYTSDKWTIKEILAHLIDTERYFNAVALDLTKKTYSDLKRDYWVFDSAGSRIMTDLIDELAGERQKSVEIYQLFDEADLAIQTEVYGKAVTVLGLGFCAVGHELSHIEVIKERYLK